MKRFFYSLIEEKLANNFQDFIRPLSLEAKNFPI